MEDVRVESRATWLSEDAWVVEESFDFSSTGTIQRAMFVSRIERDRLRVRADDMPHGADVFLSANAFRFAPYVIAVRYGPATWHIRCLDDNVIDASGRIHDTVRMYFFGLHVATLTLGVEPDRA